jgi:hypothetical protein
VQLEHITLNDMTRHGPSGGTGSPVDDELASAVELSLAVDVCVDVVSAEAEDVVVDEGAAAEPSHAPSGSASASASARRHTLSTYRP